MDGVEIRNPHFARYILSNATLETLASGFRWIEGPVWMGDADCLLFQDLPNDRTMRWTEGVGASVYRSPSNYANGQTRDRQGRLIACSHRGRCLYRTECNGWVTTLVDRHNGKRLNAPNDVVVKSDGSIWFTDPLYGISNDYEGGRQVSNSRPRFTASIRKVATYASWQVISRARTGSPSRPTRGGFTFLKLATKQQSIRANIFASSTLLMKVYLCPGEIFFTRSNPATAMACVSTRTAIFGAAPPTVCIA